MLSTSSTPHHEIQSEDFIEHSTANSLEDNNCESSSCSRGGDGEYIVEAISKFSDKLFGFQSCTDEDDLLVGTVLGKDEEDDEELVLGDTFKLINGVMYRVWDFDNSYLPNFIEVELFRIGKGFRVMCIEGLPVDVWHCSELVESCGKVFALTRSKTLYESLLKLSHKRNNIIPIHCQSKLYHPSEYESIIQETIDTVYANTFVSYSMEIIELVSNRFFDHSKYNSVSVVLHQPDGRSLSSFLLQENKEYIAEKFTQIRFHLIEEDKPVAILIGQYNGTITSSLKFQ